VSTTSGDPRNLNHFLEGSGPLRGQLNEAAQAAVAMATTSNTTRAAVRRFGFRWTGGGGGGGAGARMAGADTSHGDGTLHSGGSAGVVLSSPAGPWSSIPSMIPGCPAQL